MGKSYHNREKHDGLVLETGKNYYNTNAYDKLLKLSNEDVQAGFKMCEDYIEKYPEDCSAYIAYAHLLIKLGRFDEASKIIDETEIMLNKANRKADVINLLTKSIAFSRIKIACYQEKYDVALRLCGKYKYIFDGFDIDLGLIVGYCRNKLGMCIQERDDNNRYLVNQIIEYSYDSFREHIEKHFIDTKKDNGNASYFFSDFKIEEVLREIYKNIPSDKKAYLGFIDNHYFFKYDNCGKCQGNADFRRAHEKSRVVPKTTDYFQVVTFPNSADIITICPCETPKGFPYVDLNYLKEEDIVKTKRKSQIDKFNERYKNY